MWKLEKEEEEKTKIKRQKGGRVLLALRGSNLLSTGLAPVLVQWNLE